MNTKGGAGAARVAIGLLLVVLLIWQADFQEIVAALAAADPVLLATGFASFGGVTLVETLRLMLVYRRYPLSFGGAAYLYFTGAFFANFLPGSVGGDVYRLHLLRRLGDGLARPFGLLALLRVNALFTMIAMAIVYGTLAFPHLQEQVAAAGVPDLGIDVAKPAFFAVFAVVAVLGLPVGRRWIRRLGPHGRRALEASRAVGGGDLTRLTVLGVGVWLLRAASLYCFALALGVRLPLGDLFLVVAATNIISLLPFSVGSFGIREGALAGGLGLLGVPLATGVALALLSRCALSLVTLVGAGLHLGRGRVGREELIGAHTD